MKQLYRNPDAGLGYVHVTRFEVKQIGFSSLNSGLYLTQNSRVRKRRTVSDAAHTRTRVLYVHLDIH